MKRSIDILAEVSAKQKRSLNVYSAFHDFVARRGCKYPKSDDELIDLLKKFACEYWIVVRGDLNDIKQAYPTFRVLYVSENFGNYLRSE